MAVVDVVVVSYNSAGELRDCVAGLAGLDWLNVIVVDNDSADDSLGAVADLPVDAVASGRNGGFAFGVNLGWRRGNAPYVLLLNPDARIAPDAVKRLVAALERDGQAAIAAPRIVHDDGSLELSQRRFPTLRSTYAQALFLHRLFPHADWSDEVVRDPRIYDADGAPDWVSGACLLVRRRVLEQLGGLDETFFMYGEDKDLARRARTAGHRVRFVAAAVCAHAGGRSTAAVDASPMLSASRRRYARKHAGNRAGAYRAGIALGHVTHLVAGRGGRAARRGHVRALAALFGPLEAAPSRSARSTADRATRSSVEQPPVRG